MALDLPLIAAVTLVLAAVIYNLGRQRSSGVLPPGPPPTWLIGNRIPSTLPWRWFEGLTKRYGPLTTVWIGRRPLIVVGTFEAAADVLEKQGSKSPSRPQAYWASTLLSGGMRILLVPSGERWRRLRKASHTHLQPSVIGNYEPLQTRAASNVLLDILHDPDQHQMHAKRYAASLILTITYGKQTPTSYTDPEIVAAHKCQARLGSVAKPGSTLVDYAPLLRWVPGYGTIGKRWHADELALFKGQLDVVKNRFDAHEAEPCLATHLFEHPNDYQLSYNEMAYLCGSFFGAGSDTSAAVAFMAAATTPEAQQRVQDELDRVVGRSRLPTFADKPDLQYTLAYVKEALRWRPISSGGFMHETTDEITYDGYVIPAGTAIVGNHWSILRDPARFPDPDRFQPERWLEPRKSDTAPWEPTTDKALRASPGYGFGRRLIANNSVYINVALVLWAFKLDEKPGHKIDTLAFTSTANSHPLDGMPIRFTPRFPGVVEQIKALQAWN